MKFFADNADYFKAQNKIKESKSKLPNSFDTQDWAKEFVLLVKKNPSIATDEATMIT